MRAPQTSKDDAAKQFKVTAPTRGRTGSKRNPEFEVALGARIRAARLAAGVTQTALGNAIGISFQQVQKYENGRDRVAASTLHDMAVILGIHPGSLFDEILPSDTTSPTLMRDGPLKDLRNARRIGERIERLKNSDVVRRLMALVNVMLDVQAGAVDDSEHTSDDEPCPPPPK